MSRLKKLNKNYLYLCGILVVLLILSRFLFLGDRPAHHDEGMLAYFAYQLASLGDYTYTPQIHGPVLFYLTALAFKIFSFKGALRISMAVCGLILGVLPLLFFKRNPKVAISTSAFILISPILTYYSRFLVHTGIYVLFVAGFVLFFWRFWQKFKALNLYVAAAFLALMFGTSETTYIFCAVVAAFIPVVLLLNKKAFLIKWAEFKAFVKRNIFDLLSAILIFLIVWLLVYSVGLTNLESLKISIPNPFNSYYGLGFWLAQHKVKLGGQPWYYYIMLGVIYELPVMVAFFSAIPKVIKNRRPFELFLVWWTLGTFIGFSWAGEKFPWLFLPSLIAITISAGYLVGTYWSEFSKVLKIILAILVAWTVFVSVRLNFFGSDNTSELPVYVQTPRSFESLEDQMKIDCQGRDKDCILIDPNITWPLSWDFYHNGRLEQFSDQSNLEKTNYALLSPESDASAFKEGWVRENVQLRDWWVPEKCREFKCMGNYLNYYVTRKIWNSKGGFDILLFSREEMLK